MTKVHMKTNMKMRILKEKRHHIFHMMMPSIIIGSDSPYGGYVVSWSSPGVNGDPLFINIGADYPDKSRLTVVIWGENRDDTTEDIVDSLLGKEVVVFGSPYEYNGAAQIEIMDPSELLTYEEFIDAYENQ